MARRVPPWATVLLAGLLLASGCIGQVTDLAGAGPTEASIAATGDAADAARAGDEAAEFSAVSFVLELSAKSERTLRITNVELSPVPDGPAAFVPKTGSVQPGRSLSLGAIAVPTGSEVPQQTLAIELFDGLGTARLSVTIDAWTAHKDRVQTIRVVSTSDGQVGVERLEGPLPAEATPPRAVPEYGYLVWPDGDRQALTGFPHAVHVPQQYPNLAPGTTARFTVETPGDADIRWQLDETARTGASFTFQTTPGVHDLNLSTAAGPATTLSVHVDADRSYHGTILTGEPVTEHGTPATVDQHPLAVRERANWLKLMLRPADDANLLEDMDLRLIDAEGDTVANASTAGNDGETLTLRTTPGAGDYTIEVRGARGVALDYELTAHIDY